MVDIVLSSIQQKISPLIARHLSEKSKLFKGQDISALGTIFNILSFHMLSGRDLNLSPPRRQADALWVELRSLVLIFKFTSYWYLSWAVLLELYHKLLCPTYPICSDLAKQFIEDKYSTNAKGTMHELEQVIVSTFKLLNLSIFWWICS